MKLITNVFLIVLILISFSQCSSAQKLQEEALVKFGKAYYQNWVAGVQGGGSGIDIFIPVEQEMPKEQIKLDSIYFRGNVSKLEMSPTNTSLFIGRFLSESNQKKDIIMSGNPNDEYGNEAPKLKVKIAFELKENECVVSYIEDNKVKYFKIENVVEKQTLYYPSVPPKKQ